MSIYACPFCFEKTYDDIISLAKHWSRTHKQSTEELYLKLHSLNNAPKCGCGCGESVKFLDAGRGYSKYVRGHQSRIQNNFQTEKSRNNSVTTRRKMIEDGSFKPFHLKETGEHWGKGLTKETDERIRKMAETVSLPEERARRSERLRQNRLSGVVQTLQKREHSQWKGGISPLNHFCHANRRLYNDWKYPKMVAANLKCSICANTGKIEVHHNQETFSVILRRIAAEHGWEEKIATFFNDELTPELLSLKDAISAAVAEYHISNNVSGVVLCQGCHKAEHKRLKSSDIQPPLPP
jgi:hypothetical protein